MFLILQVSWIRSRDLQILTSGQHVFTSDSRFTIAYDYEAISDVAVTKSRDDSSASSTDVSDDQSESWSLHITNVRSEDSGQYECQINTEPKLKINVTLVVRGRFIKFGNM